MDRFHIYESIGKGKHSVVYKGREKKSIQYYAVKSVEKSQRQRVLQEVHALRAIKHERALKFVAWYETRNHLWLVLEYCVGGTLLNVLKQDGRLPESSIRRFAVDLCRGLRALHGAGLLHCDVKPSNALLSEHGEVKLCGFGLSRRVASNVAMLSSSHGGGDTMNNNSRASVASSTTTSSSSYGNGVSSTFTSSRGSGHLSLAKRGSPAYMAPELFTSIGVHSYASDLWALGCVLYEFVAGYPPFARTRLSELVEAVLEEEPEPLPRERCSESLESLIMGLLIKRPHQRMTWQDVVEHEFFRRPAFVSSSSGGAGTSNATANERGGSGDVSLSIKKLIEEHKKKPLPKETAFEQMAQKLKAEDLAARLKLLNPKSPGGNVSVVHGGLLTASLRQSCDVGGLSRAARTNLDRERSALGYGNNNKGGSGNSGSVNNVNSNVNVDAEKNYFDSENRNSVDVVMETADFEVNFALENFSQNDENNRNVANTSHDETFEDARGDNQRVSVNSTTSSVAEYEEKRRTVPMKAPGVQRLCTVDLPSTPARTPKRNEREDGNSGGSSSDEDDDNVEYHEVDGVNGEDDDENDDENTRKKKKGSVIILSPDTPNGRRKKSLLDNRRSAGCESALLKSPPRGGNREQIENGGRDSRTMMAKTPWKHRTMPSDLDETMDDDENEEDANDDDDPNALAIVPNGEENDDEKECDESVYSISTLSTHASDLVVRPIVNNRRVEPNGAAMDPVHDAKALPFPALDVKSVLGLSRPELEAFLTAVYRSVAESSPMRSKVNALAYFETLCSNAEAANVLVNSSLASMFVEVLAQSKAPTLRTRLCSILGLLFRHATEIGDELLANEKTNICETLAEVIDDSNERAKRKAMATLGELLFYVATQSERDVSFDDDESQEGEDEEDNNGNLAPRTKAKVGPETAAVIWGVSDKVLAAVCSKLNVTEDAVTRHYATKTIENIVTPRCDDDDDGHEVDDDNKEENAENECKHPKWVQDTFLTNATLAKLFEIALADQRESESARVTASSAAARCLASSPQLLVDFATSSVCAHYVSRLISDDSSKVSGNGLRCLNVVLSNEASKHAFLETLRASSSTASNGDTGDLKNNSTGGSGGGSAFYADENILAKELSLISERGANSINRGKALVAISALCSAHPAWLVHFTNNRILYVAEKVTLHANNDVYLTRCAECLFRTIADLSRRASDAISSEARRIIADANEKLNLETFDVNDVRRTHFSQSGATALFPALAHALCVGFMRDRVCDEAFLRKVSVFIQAAATALPSAAAAPLEEMDANNNANNKSPSKWFSGFRGGNTASKERMFQELLDRKIKASEEFRLGVSSLLETLSRDAQKSLLRFPKVTIREVLPALAKLLRGSDSPDARFLALKLTCDSMLPLLALQPVENMDDESVPEETTNVHDKEGIVCCQIDADDKRYLAESLRTDFLPSCPALLMDEDPIPLYALKLLAGSINNGGAEEEEENANARGDEALEKALAHFASKFFAFLSLDHANNNAHNARLCLFLCRSKSSILSTRKLFTELNACERVADVLVYSRENRVEPFVEPASKMCEVLAKRAMQTLEDTSTESTDGEDLIDASLRAMRTFAEISQTFLECTTAAIDDDTAITYAEAAAEALRISCAVHPDVSTQSLLVLTSSTSSSNGVHSPGAMALSGVGESHPFCESIERFASDAFEALLVVPLHNSDSENTKSQTAAASSHTRKRLQSLRSKVIDAVANAFTAVANEGLTFHEDLSREQRERASMALGKLSYVNVPGASRASRSFAAICRAANSPSVFNK